jgi:hypothetical protein
MTTFSRSRSPRYNQLKKRALQVFAGQGGWLTPPQWAALAGFYPIRSAYSYLLRLHSFGLLERSCKGPRKLCYQLSARGRMRLSWLRRTLGN